MVHAVIMIRTGPSASQAVRDAISRVENVVDVHVVAGEFDVIAEIDGDEVYEVLDTATTEVQDTEGVEETKTYVALS
ncbi:MAG: Lrp/AsnC ligand binding domain-containing protein [Halanaeroarchaeum sp.]